MHGLYSQKHMKNCFKSIIKIGPHHSNTHCLLNQKYDDFWPKGGTIISVITNKTLKESTKLAVWFEDVRISPPPHPKKEKVLSTFISVTQCAGTVCHSFDKCSLNHVLTWTKASHYNNKRTVVLGPYLSFESIVLYVPNPCSLFFLINSGCLSFCVMSFSDKCHQ